MTIADTAFVESLLDHELGSAPVVHDQGDVHESEPIHQLERGGDTARRC
jgi:hypothetical protein